MDEKEVRHLHLRGALGAVRTAQYDGREHLVVPVVALMDGVIHAVNAATPERVTVATLTKAATSWNGRPLVLGHPVKNGRQCSANDPAIDASHRFGTIFNSRVVGTKLLMDAYVDPVRAEKLGGAEFVRRLRAGEQCEVSVGAFVQTDSVPGNHNGRAYRSSWLETTGDHLAFLPHGLGACSIEMGCGAHRAAMHLVTAEALEVLDTEHKALASLQDASEAFRSASEAFRAAIGKEISAKNAAVIQAAHDSTHSMHDHATALGAKCDREWKWLANPEGFNQYTGPGGSGGKGSGGEGKTAAEGTISKEMHKSLREKASEIYNAIGHDMQGFSEEEIADALRDRMHDELDNKESASERAAWSKLSPKEKMKLTLSVLAASVKDCTACGGTGQVKTGDTQADCEACGGSGKLKAAEAPLIQAEFKAACGCDHNTEAEMTKAERIAALLTHPHNPVKDVKVLEAASDDVIGIFEAQAVSNAKQAADLKAAQDAKDTALAKLKAAAEHVPTEEEYLKGAPESIRTLVADKKAQDAKQKADLVASLKTAAKGVYTDEELDAKPIAELLKIAQMAKVEAPADFSGRGLARAPGGDKVDYAPPDPYEAGLKTLRERAVN